MNISPKFKSLSINVLNNAEFEGASKEMTAKEFVVQKASIDGLLSGLSQKANTNFPWIPQAVLNKIQSSTPFILSLFTPGETTHVFVRANIEIMGLPIASRSLFSIKVVN
jgi:hypothetical protein